MKQPGVEMLTDWRIRIGVVCLLLLSIPAYAGPPELEFAKGVVAYSQGNLEKAHTHLSEVLTQQPENIQALSYMGQVELGLKNFQAAVELFSRVLKLQPAQVAVRLDLALALVKLKQFAQAEQELMQASGSLSERASLHYYLGYCRFHQGFYQKALQPFTRAQELDGGFAATAGYYLGLVHLKLGENEKAEEHFRKVARSDSAGQVGSLARENLAEMPTEVSDSAGPRIWGMVASLGFGYDSNVTLSNSDISGASAPSGYVSVGAWVSPLKRKKDALDISANIYRSFNMSEETKGYSLTDLAIMLRYRHRFASNHQLQLAYLFDLDMLDDLSAVTGGASQEEFGVFMQGHSGLARLRLNWSRLTDTWFEYRFRAQLFHVEERDNFGHEVLVRQDLNLFKQRFLLSFKAGAVFEDAKERNWDLRGPLAGMETRIQLISVLSLWGRIDYRREDHYRYQADVVVSGRRIDNILSVGGGLNWSIGKHLMLGASYRFLNNLSSTLELWNAGDTYEEQPYSYKRHVVSLSFSGRL